MDEYWMTGEDVALAYDLKDFELNNLICNGLEFYDAHTGKKYVNELYFGEKCRITLISCSDKDDDASVAFRVPVVPHRKTRVYCGKVLDAYCFNRSEGEICSDKIPKNSILVSFQLPDDPKELGVMFDRNRIALYKKTDVEKMALRFGLNIVQCQCLKPFEREMSQGIVKIVDEVSNEMDGGMNSDISGQDATVHSHKSISTCQRAGRMPKLSESECIKIYRKHYQENVSIKDLAENYSWENSPFYDSPKSETAKARIKSAIIRGRESTPQRERPSLDPKGKE